MAVESFFGNTNPFSENYMDIYLDAECIVGALGENFPDERLKQHIDYITPMGIDIEKKKEFFNKAKNNLMLRKLNKLGFTDED